MTHRTRPQIIDVYARSPKTWIYGGRVRCVTPLSQGWNFGSFLRGLTHGRLDAMQVKVYAQVVRGDLRKIDRVLKIQKRRAALLGLDRPIVQKDMPLPLLEMSPPKSNR